MTVLTIEPTGAVLGATVRGRQAGMENFVTARVTLGPILLLRGDAPVGDAFEKAVSIEIPKAEYRWSQAEVAKGVRFDYVVRMAQDLPEVVSSDPEGGGDVGLNPVAHVFGKGQRYHPYDHGHPGPPQFEGGPVKKGVTERHLDWDGRNWDGPSDTQQPKGPAFPPGEYTFRVEIAGYVDLGQGRRPFAIQKDAKVVITP